MIIPPNKLIIIRAYSFLNSLNLFCQRGATSALACVYGNSPTISWSIASLLIHLTFFFFVFKCLCGDIAIVNSNKLRVWIKTYCTWTLISNWTLWWDEENREETQLCCECHSSLLAIKYLLLAASRWQSLPSMKKVSLKDIAAWPINYSSQTTFFHLLKTGKTSGTPGKLFREVLPIPLNIGILKHDDNSSEYKMLKERCCSRNTRRQESLRPPQVAAFPWRSKYPHETSWGCIYKHSMGGHVGTFSFSHATYQRHENMPCVHCPVMASTLSTSVSPSPCFSGHRSAFHSVLCSCLSPDRNVQWFCAV